MQHISNFFGFTNKEIDLCKGNEQEAFILNFIIFLINASADQGINSFGNKFYAQVDHSHIAKRFYWMGKEKVRHRIENLIDKNIIIKNRINGGENIYTLEDSLYAEFMKGSL